MSRLRPLLWLTALAVLPACAKSLSDTAVVVQVTLDPAASPGTASPAFLQLDFYDRLPRLMGGRVPKAGRLPARAPGDALARVVVQAPEYTRVGSDVGLTRRAVVRGYDDAGQQTWLGGQRYTILPGVWTGGETAVLLRPARAGELDADGDTVPDEVDDCPGADDRLGCASAPLPDGGGAVEDASGSVEDAAPDSSGGGG